MTASDAAGQCTRQDVMWLALTGELPLDTEREALSRALTWLAPMHVGEGPTHAAVLAKVTGAPEEVVPAITTVALGQRIAAELVELTELFAWLGVRTGPVPAAVIEPSPTDAQRAAWARLCNDVGRWFHPTCAFDVAVPWRRVPAAYAVLHLLGIRDRARLQALVTIARLPVALAEAACTGTGSVKSYPTLTPAYRYVEES